VRIRGAEWRFASCIQDDPTTVYCIGGQDEGDAPLSHPHPIPEFIWDLRIYSEPFESVGGAFYLVCCIRY